MISVRQVLDVAAINVQLAGPGGSVVRDMLRRGLAVQTRAKELCPVGQGQNYGGPLRDSILIAVRPGHTPPTVIVGTIVNYAYWVHEGTGIHGPHGSPIVPTRRTVLKFTGRDGQIHFAPSVQGQESKPFLRDALIAAKT